MAHTSAPGMLSRNAVRNGMGLPPRRTYTATCVDSNNPQAVQIARITHQRGYDECARRRDGIMNRPRSLSPGTRSKYIARDSRASNAASRIEDIPSNGQDWNEAATNRHCGTVKCGVRATNGAGGLDAHPAPD